MRLALAGGRGARPVTRVVGAVVASAALAGCPGPGPDPDAGDGAALDCGDRLGVDVRVPDHTYQPLAQAGDGVELVLGFQGFRYLYVRARLDIDPGPTSAAAVVQLDGDNPRSQPLYLTFAPDGGGVVSPATQVYFNDDPLPSLVDRGVSVQLVLSPRCSVGGHTVLRYDPSCYEGPDGQPVCDGGDGLPDGGL